MHGLLLLLVLHVFLFFCSRPNSPSHSCVARALSLCFVIAWFQLIATSVVPVIIMVLTNPLQTLAPLAMVVSTLFGMVVFLAVLVYTCQQHDHSKRCLLFAYSVILVGVFTMVCLATFLFLVITAHGVQVNSVGVCERSRCLQLGLLFPSRKKML